MRRLAFLFFFATTGAAAATLASGGRHATTGEPIEPMSAAGRLADPAKIEKWFGRNCRRTVGRDLLLPALLLLTPPARGDDDEDHEEHGLGRASGPSGVAPVYHPTRTSECGSRHLACSPGLLPARSWTALLADLSHHFGDDASVSEPVRAELVACATTHAADVSTYRLSQRITRVTAGQTPLRISDLPGLRGEHGEIPRSWITGNPEVRSLANCAACHTRAAEGRFREGEIRIPGHAGWDD